LHRSRLPRSICLPRFLYIPAALLIGVWALSQLLNLGAVAQQPSDGVAYAAHVGGFIFGAVAARLFEGRQRLGEPKGNT
jgi:membrane associated rhomboid family serine protease